MASAHPVNPDLGRLLCDGYNAPMITIAALYRFTPFVAPDEVVAHLRDTCERFGIRGTLLVAEEGLNGTIAGPRDCIDGVIDEIRALPGCRDIEVKTSQSDDNPFGRMKVRRKREIVTMGQPGVDPLAAVGTYVDPSDWNDLIEADDVAVIDTRNDYEVAIGTFRNAVDPETAAFGDFPAWWDANRAHFEGKRIAMFCTGGIRCEKATNYLIGQGVSEVFHLRGGILKYLETVPSADSLWDGQCFVFDERVSVGHSLTPGNLGLCRGCRRPVSAEDRARPGFEDGVSCHRCVGTTTHKQKARYRTRHRQIEQGRLRLGASGSR